MRFINIVFCLSFLLMWFFFGLPNLNLNINLDYIHFMSLMNGGVLFLSAGISLAYWLNGSSESNDKSKDDYSNV